jgi:FG-GAP-like repeat
MRFTSTDWATMHSVGFNAASDGGVQDNGAAQAAAGINGMVWVNAYSNTSCTQTMTDAAIAALVAANVSAGNVGLRYEVGDEPTVNGCDAAPTYTHITGVIHGADATAKTSTIDDQFQSGNPIRAGVTMKGSVDILAFDIYPCRAGPCDFAAIDSAVQQIHAAQVTNWEFVIQDFSSSPWRWPTPAEILAQFDHWKNQGAIGYWVYAWDYQGQSVINQPGNLAALQQINAQLAGASLSNSKPLAADFDGDGKADLALNGVYGTSVALSTGTAFANTTTWAPFPFYGSVATLAGDVTGDGKADLVAVNAGQTFVLPSTGADFAAPSGWSNIAFYGTRGTYLADVSGDGKADLVAVNNTSVWVMFSTGSVFGPPIPWSSTPFYGNLSTQIGDVSGDGKADLIAINSTSVWVMTSTGSGFGSPAQWSGTPFYGNVQTMLVDANGDAKVDLVALNWTSTWIITSTGSGFGPPTQWSNTPFYGQVGTLSGDVNGDHKVDLVAINPLSVWVAQSTGTALAAPAMWL